MPPEPGEILPMRRTGLVGALVFGALCACAGIAAGGFVALGSRDLAWNHFLLAAPLGAFLSGMGAWWWVAARAREVSGGRGALAGALAGCVSHPLSWGLLFLLLDTTDGAPVKAESVVVLSLMSLVVIGWLTVPLGALLGWGVARWHGTDATG